MQGIEKKIKIGTLNVAGENFSSFPAEKKSVKFLQTGSFSQKKWKQKGEWRETYYSCVSSGRKIGQ
jgi:hypothetical protein